MTRFLPPIASLPAPSILAHPSGDVGATWRLAPYVELALLAGWTPAGLAAYWLLGGRIVRVADVGRA